MSIKRINPDFQIGTIVLFDKGPKRLGDLVIGQSYIISKIKPGFDDLMRESEFLYFEGHSQKMSYDHKMFTFYEPSYGQVVTTEIAIKKNI